MNDSNVGKKRKGHAKGKCSKEREFILGGFKSGTLVNI